MISENMIAFLHEDCKALMIIPFVSFFENASVAVLFKHNIDLLSKKP